MTTQEGLKYCFYKSRDKIGSLCRICLDYGNSIFDSWQNGEWVHTPHLIRITGIGGDTDHDFEEITKAEAEKYMKKHM